MDPDRFIRERGVEAYKEASSPGKWETFSPRGLTQEEYKSALRGARRQSDYLIERRGMQLFPGASAEQKVKAINPSCYRTFGSAS